MTSAAPADAASGVSVVARGLEVTYGRGGGAVRALKGIDLDIDAGEFVVLVGPSGSGKTTLLNVLGAIEPSTGGSVTVGGVELAGMSSRQRTTYRRNTVGFVFQLFNLVPSLTALENVELTASLTGHHVGDRAQQTLTAIGLGERLDHFPNALSGGEQQRVAIARGLVKDPPLVLADEPTASLDLDTGKQVLTRIKRLHEESGRTVLMVAHNTSIAQMADRVVTIRYGELMSDERNAHPVPADQLTW